MVSRSTALGESQAALSAFRLHPPPAGHPSMPVLSHLWGIGRLSRHVYRAQDDPAKAEATSTARIAARRRSLLGDPGLAHAFENALSLGQIRLVAAHRRPGGAGAGDGVGRVERKAGLQCGTRLVKSTESREGGGQQEICYRIVSVGLDPPSTPGDRLLATAENALRNGRVSHPIVSHRIARTEPQGLDNVSLGFFGATDKNLT